MPFRRPRRGKTRRKTDLFPSSGLYAFLTVIRFERVSKNFGGQAALSSISFAIDAGEFVFVSGASGAGKTTLLKLVAAIERPSAGLVEVNGQDLGALKARDLPHLRRNLGLIFQDHKLLYDRSAFDNVVLPLAIVDTPHADAARRARAALDKVGLLERAKSLPPALSGGEQQRLAIARAIVCRPAILIADEPTANLDGAAARQIISMLRDFNQVGVTVMISTHDDSIFTGFSPTILHLKHASTRTEATS